MIAVGVLFSSHEDFAIGVAGGERVKVNGAIPIAITISAFSFVLHFLRGCLCCHRRAAR